MTTENVQGAAVSYVNESIISEESRYAAGQKMGEPTEHIGGQHISHHQQKKKPSSGHRSYKLASSSDMEQSQQRIYGGRANNGDANFGIQTTQCTPAKMKGVSQKRTKRRLKKLALNGSPATQTASEEILEDMVCSNRSTALDHIIEAEDDSEPESDDEVTASQQIPKDAVHLKKLETKRKGQSNN